MFYNRKVGAIVAIDEKNGYSKNGAIPWYYKEDFQWFSYVTRENICIMGRGTYEFIKQRLGGDQTKEDILPGRTSFVLSSTMKEVANAYVVKSVDDIVNKVANFQDNRQIWFIGGENVYRVGLSLCSIVHVTRIHRDFQCDKFFPLEQVTSKFDLIYSDDSHNDFTFETYSNAFRIR